MANKTMVLGIQISKSDKMKAKKDLEDVANTGVKQQQEANKQIIENEVATNKEIERLVAEREKRIREIIRKDIEKNKSLYQGEELKEDYWYKYYTKEKKRSTEWGGSTPRLIDPDTKMKLESPAELEEILKGQLQKKQEILDIDKKITEEQVKQNDTTAKITDTTVGTKSKKSGFLEIMKTGATKLGSILLGSGKVVIGTIGKLLFSALKLAGIAAISAIGLAISGIFTLIGGIIARAVSMINDQSKAALANRSKEINEMSSKIYTETRVIKAMFDSIAYTILPAVQSIVKSILDGIIEAIRFVQHVVYALTKVDILKFTGQRLKENMQKTSQYAKELAKVLMGFDEANILNDSNSSANLYNKNYADQLIARFEIDENYFDNLKKKAKEALDWVTSQYNNAKDNIKKGIDDTQNRVYNFDYKKAYGNWDTFFKGLDLSWLGLQKVADGAFMQIDGVSEMVTGFMTGDWDLFFSGVKKWFDGLIQKVFGWRDTIIGVGIALYGAIKGAFAWLKEKWYSLMNYLKNKFDEIFGPVIAWICDRFNDMKKFLNETFNLNLKVDADTSQAQSKLKSVLGTAIDTVVASNPFMNPLTIGSRIKGGINTIKNLFGLDGGGLILPQPGHGVPVGVSAIAGERRAEAIIPFENPTAMEKIGEAIGKYVNIAIQNQMVVDGRVLATATNNQISKERFLMNR